MRQQWQIILAVMALSSTAWANSSTISEKILLDFRDDVTTEDIKTFEAKYQVKTYLNSIHSDDEELRLADIDPAQQSALLTAMQNDPLLEHAEPLALYTLPQTSYSAPIPDIEENPEKFPNDPMYKSQWHLDQINMPAAWTEESGKGVIVAVIDTGVAYEDYKKFQQVPDLANTKFVPGYDFVNKTAHGNDDHGHGTHVAGTISQSTNNGIGVAGVAYRATIMPIKVLSKSGAGSTADIADGIKFAADNGAKVINMSLGGPFPSGVMRDAVAYAVKKGVVVVAASGNSSSGRVGYPAAYDGVIAVSATDIEEKITFYSNYGDDIDIAAPGGDTRHDKNKDGIPDGVLQNTIEIGNPLKNGYHPYMGTSMASPHVAGVAALVIAAGVTDPEAVEKLLYETADRGPAERNGVKPGKKWDNKYGHGLVDANAAVKKATFFPNIYKSLLAIGFAFLAVGTLRRKQQLAPGKNNILLSTGLLAGASGLLFFLPAFGLSLGVLDPFLGQGFPSWDLGLLGASFHGNILFFSFGLPLLGIALFGNGRLRALSAGFALGVAAHLLYASVFRVFDISLIPGECLDRIWLFANGGISGLLGYLTLKKSS